MGEILENGFICICCTRRKERNEAYTAEKYLGICKACNEKLVYIPKGTVFKGGDNLSSLISVVTYNATARNVIRRYKFQGQQRYSLVFAEMMYEYLKDFNLRKNFDLVTMVPLSRKRFTERGYNQTELLAEPLAKLLGIEFNSGCVFKKRNTAAQSSIENFLQRRNNVKDAYIADSIKIKNRNIILIDDVYTTGSTMEECAKELKLKGAESVLGITLAKVVKEV